MGIRRSSWSQKSVQTRAPTSTGRRTAFQTLILVRGVGFQKLLPNSQTRLTGTYQEKVKGDSITNVFHESVCNVHFCLAKNFHIAIILKVEKMLKVLLFQDICAKEGKSFLYMKQINPVSSIPLKKNNIDHFMRV